MRQITYIEQLEILEGLPESDKFLREKIEEIEKILKPTEKKIVKILIKINSLEDQFSRYFWKEALKQIYLPTGYINSLAQLKRLHQLRKSCDSRQKKSSLLDYNKLKESAKHVPIESLFTFQKVRKSGNKIIALCPFHNEKTPSFYIYTDTNSFHCFGECQQSGDSIYFIQRINNINFKQAVLSLAGVQND